MPKVSVIIPNYNHAQFLKQRIESVLNQTYQHFEVIFLDDNSTDNSREVFAKYANHPKITYAIFNEINSGSPFKQWNKGFSLATGEYIWIAESDDYADSNLLKKLVEKLEIYPSVGLVYSQSWKIDQNGKILGQMKDWTDDLDNLKWDKDYIDSLDKFGKFLFVKNVIPNASAVLFRSCFVNHLTFDIERLRLCGDWFFWIKILLESDVAFVSEPLNYFRTHSATVRNTTQLKDHITQKISILDCVYNSVRLSCEIRCQILINIIESSFELDYSSPLSYQQIIDLYKKIINFNCLYQCFFNLHFKFFQNLFSWLRFRKKRIIAKIIASIKLRIE